MPLAPQAPYDSLAKVTELTRIALADFIQNIQPNNVGTVSTDATGYIVSWVSGNTFSALFDTETIIINGLPYPVQMVLSPTSLRLGAQAPANQVGVNYSLVIPTGDFFADNQAYVVPTVNLAWRQLLEKLDDASHPRLRPEIDLLYFPPAASSDLATQSWIDWTNFFDGVNLWSPANPPPTTGVCPVLPPDFVTPRRLLERQSLLPVGATNPNRFTPMHPAADGLPSEIKGTRDYWWDWREDALYFVGSTLLTDKRLIYNNFLADITVAAGGFAATPIPIMRSARALSYYAAAIFVTPRGGAATAADFTAKGDAAADQLTNRQAKILQGASFRRKSVYNSSNRYQGTSYRR
jgi:hypothetical protein